MLGQNKDLFELYNNTLNVLLIEDNDLKREVLLDTLEVAIPNIKFIKAKNLFEAIYLIKQNKSNIDLIVTDWCFPENYEMPAEFDMGLNVLNYLRDESIHIPTIICSSDFNNECYKEFNFVIGLAPFGDRNTALDIKKIYEEYLNKKNSKPKSDIKKLRKIPDQKVLKFV